MTNDKVKITSKHGFYFTRTSIVVLGIAVLTWLAQRTK